MTDSFRSSRYESPVRIVYSTRTGKSLVISNELSAAFENNQYSDLPADVLESLIDIEAVVPAKEHELSSIIKRNKAAIADDTMLNYVIQPTAQCQLGCNYCGQLHTKHNMEKENYDKILRRIEQKLLVGNYKSLHISWFGSEPLYGWKNIQELTPLIKKLATNYGCAYSAMIVTNGLSLKPGIFEDLVRKYDIEMIEITLDGVAEFHDQRRHTKEGVPTFDIIFNNLLNICNKPDFHSYNVNMSIRCNVDERNHEGVLPLINLLAQHNLQDKVSFYIAPIHSWGNDAHKLSLTKEQYSVKEVDWILELAKHNFRLTGLIPGPKEIVCISVSPDAEIIDAYGNVFNCTEVPYVPVYENSEFLLGNIKVTPPDMIVNDRVYQDWNDKILNENNTCTTCRMLPVCGGMCPKSWAEGNAACPSNKYNIEDKLVLAYLYANESVN